MHTPPRRPLTSLLLTANMAMASTCSRAVSTLDRAFIYSLILRHQARTLSTTRLRLPGPLCSLPPQSLGLQLTPTRGAFSTTTTNFEPIATSARHNNSLLQLHHQNYRPALQSTRPHRNLALQLYSKHAYSTAAAALNDLDLVPNLSRPRDVTSNVSPSIDRYSDQASPEVVLSVEQRFLMEQVINKKRSIFFTGSAGTGKSVLLRQLIDELKELYLPGNVAVTASTGIAACNIGGCTLHSFAGVGLGNGTVDQLMVKLDANKDAKKRWRKAKVLIIDEISMIDGELFDKLEEIARRLKKNKKPFGGIQLILTGDFFQLPPVVQDTIVNTNSTEASMNVSPSNLPRAQTSRTTTTIIKNPSASDFELAASMDDVLNEPLLTDIATMEPPKHATLCFESQSWSQCIHHTLQLTEVFRQRDPQFIKMLTEVRHGELSPETCEIFKKLERAPEYPDDGIQATELYALRKQVDKSNHRKLDALPGDSYVYEPRDSGPMAEWMHKFSPAPSKLQLKEHAQVMLIKNLSPTLVNGSMGIVMGFREDTTMDEESGQWLSSYFPVVRFVGEEDDLVIRPEEWRMEQPDGEVIGSRLQVPLILAWAMSIHKSQGQTMDRVQVDMGKIFEAGQGYVALSRATSLAGLQVLNFNKKAIQTNPRVAEFYDTLGSVQELMEQVNAPKTKSKKRRTTKVESMELTPATPQAGQVLAAFEVVAPAAATAASTMARRMAGRPKKVTTDASNSVLKELTQSRLTSAQSSFPVNIWNEAKSERPQLDTNAATNTLTNVEDAAKRQTTPTLVKPTLIKPLAKAVAPPQYEEIFGALPGSLKQVIPSSTKAPKKTVLESTPKGFNPASKASGSAQLKRNSTSSSNPAPKASDPKLRVQHQSTKTNDQRPREYPSTNSFGTASKTFTPVPKKSYDQAPSIAPQAYDMASKASDQAPRAYSPKPKQYLTSRPDSSDRKWVPSSKATASGTKSNPSKSVNRW